MLVPRSVHWISLTDPEAESKTRVRGSSGQPGILKIPPEILAAIIREATSPVVPKLLNKPDVSPFSTLTDAIRIATPESNKTKCAVSAVSREWRSLSAPFVHEYVYLDDQCDWEGHARVLEEGKTLVTSLDDVLVGTYVRRVELSTSIWSTNQTFTTGSIFQRCPKLESVILGTEDGDGPRLPDKVIYDLFRSNVSLLHTLCFRSTLQNHAVSTIIDHAHKLRSLYTLSMRFSYFEVPRGVYRSVALEDLTTLELISGDASDLLHVLKDWKLPSLCRLSLRGQFKMEEEGTFSFFKVHGAKLTIFEFDYLSSAAQDVFDLCPGLIELALSATYVHLNEVKRHPNVVRVGFRGLTRVRDSRIVRNLTITCFDTLFPILLNKNAFPNVTLVRLLDYIQDEFEDQGWAPRDVQRWFHWVQRFQQGHVSLKDHDKHTIKLRPEICPGGCSSDDPR